MKKTQVEQESRVIVGAHGVASEEDHLVLGKVVRVGVISLAIFAVGAIWAWRFQVSLEKDILPPDGVAGPKPAAVGQYEIGIINQRMFEQEHHAEEKLSGQREALKNGWGDKPGVVAHMPIDQAMDRVIADAQKPPPAPPAPPPGLAPAPGKAPAPAPAPGSAAPTPTPTPH